MLNINDEYRVKNYVIIITRFKISFAKVLYIYGTVGLLITKTAVLFQEFDVKVLGQDMQSKVKKDKGINYSVAS